MNDQEIFDKVAEHLFAQGRPSHGSDNISCMYRGNNGTMCAVGCLISNEMYDPMMDKRTADFGTSLSSLLERGFVLPDYFKDNVELLEDLQNIHDFCDLNEDNTFSTNDLNKRLKNTAKDFDLKFVEKLK